MQHKQSWKVRAQQHLRQKWDIELTICLSIAAGILHLLGIVDLQVAIGFILVIFSVLAVNILRNRWADDKLGKTVQDVDRHMPAIKKVADHLQDIEIVAERLPRVEDRIESVDSHMSTIERVAANLPNIEIVVNRLPLITEVLESLKMYSRQDEAEEALLLYINEIKRQGIPVQEATIIRYSINPVLVDRLLENNTKVTVFMQDETTAESIGSQQQADSITTAYNELKKRLPKAVEEYPLTVYKFKPPCSMVGVKLDNQLIYMGWYTYEYTDDSNRFRSSHSNDTIQLYGHDKTALIVQKGYYGFSMLETTFRSIVDNYQRNATCILPTSSQQSQGKNNRPPISLLPKPEESVG